MRTNKKVFLLTIGIVSIGWLIVMCAIDKLNPSGISGSIGLLFGMLGFVLVLIFNLQSAQGKVENDTSAFAIPFICSLLFLGGILLINTIFIIVTIFIPVNFILIKKIVIIVNIIMMVCYVVCSLYFLVYLRRLREKSVIFSTETADLSHVSSAIGKLLSITENREIKTEILKLKEVVDYSANTHTRVSSNVEQTFLSQISSIQRAVQENADPKEIKQIILQAIKLWHERNVSIN